MSKRVPYRLARLGIYFWATYRFTNSGSEKRKENVIEYMIGSKEEGPLL
jgi:hypothetical protein